MKTNSRTAMTCSMAAATLLALTDIASAHPGHSTGGIVAGAAHPLLGIDHVLAMLAVGLCAAQMGGRAIWLLPVTFLALMGAGGALGLHGHPIPMLEQAIAASVLVLGLMVATGANLKLPWAGALVGVFALFHGYAHGSEMSAGVAPAQYAAGFLLATAALLLAGVALGRLLTRHLPLPISRWAGGAIALCGLLLLAA